MTDDKFDLKPADRSCLRCRDGLATAAHDLRTPIAVVSGYVDLLLSLKLGKVNASQLDVLREMSASINRLQQFTDGFLSYYSTQSTVDLDPQEQDINDCLKEVFVMWAPQFKTKRITHVFEPSNELPKFLFDYHKVQHIAANLLDNALKFTRGGGTIRLETQPYCWERRMTLKNRDKNDRRRRKLLLPNSVRVTVSDTGPGVAAEFHQEIFEQFHQVNPRLDDDNGRGLGLTSAKRLVGMHGGKIWVESDSGHGSKFIFLLPFNKGKAGLRSETK